MKSLRISWIFGLTLLTIGTAFAEPPGISQGDEISQPQIVAKRTSPDWDGELLPVKIKILVTPVSPRGISFSQELPKPCFLVGTFKGYRARCKREWGYYIKKSNAQSIAKKQGVRLVFSTKKKTLVSHHPDGHKFKQDLSRVGPDKKPMSFDSELGILSVRGYQYLEAKKLRKTWGIEGSGQSVLMKDDEVTILFYGVKNTGRKKK